MRLVAPTPHEIVLRPWRSSAAVESWYGSTLEKMVRAMVLSVSYWVKATYGKNVGLIAMDEADGHEFHGNQYVEGESGEKEHGKGGVKHEVEKLIKEGKLSYAEIAKVVATKFGGKTSKESVAWYASKLKQAGKEKPAASKEEREKPRSISDWHQIGKQMGSNPGGVFEDEHGVSYYTKFSKDEDHARNEVLASKLYQAAGVNVIESQLVQKDGQFGVAGEMKPGLSKGTPAQLASAKGVAEGFVADAWLANRDVVGLGYDNLLLNKAGEAVRVDPGGALLYRAQGADKPGFGNEAKELDSLRNSSINEQAYKVFGKLTDKQLEDSASHVTSIPDARIREIIEAHGPGDTAARAALADKMIARKASIAKQFPGAAQAHDSMMTDSPSSDMDNVMAKLAKQWGATFNSMARTIAHAFTQQCLTHHDLAMKTSLDHAGFSVPFQMTPHMADRVEGLTAENVSLIKSIPAEYLGKVHAKVLESVRKGRDLKELTSELQGLVEIGKPDWSHNQVVRRARFIARQENNKATAAFQQIRLLDLGVDESYWQHTMASKEPRPEHEGWSDDGLRYKVSKGMYSDEAGKWVLPGEDYNCGCTGAPIVPGYNDKGKNTENDEKEAA